MHDPTRPHRGIAATAAVAAAAFATCLFLAPPDPASAGGIQFRKDDTMINHSQGEASASASARASSSANAAKPGGTGCRASSSASAEARAGDEHAVDRDEDFSMSEDGGCRAQAESRASARSGPATAD